jgi:hypothetical protein
LKRMPKHARSHHRPRHALAARVGAGIAVAVVAITLVTSYTASTSVPTSSVGMSTHARLISQMAPAGCSSLTLTTLVQGTGTFSNSTSHALVLGSAGANTITDTGTGNCIIGGGGTNNITGTSTDICITGPTLNVANPCPVAVPPTTTTTPATTTTLPTTTTTTVLATTTTSTTLPPSNGVTATPTSTNSDYYSGQETLTLANTHSITALTITIKVQQTTGVSYNSEGNSFAGGSVTQSSTTSGGVIKYLTTLNSGQTISAGSSVSVYAQFSGTGVARVTTADTWTITSTSNGIVSTISGHF